MHSSRRNAFTQEGHEDEWFKTFSEILSFKCNALSNLGLAYEDGGNLRQSTKFLFQCIYMKESFQSLPERFRGDWETQISRAKHSLGVCYMKLKLPEEGEKYLSEDLLYCEQKRVRCPLNTEWARFGFLSRRSYFQACVAEGQTRLSLGRSEFLS